MYRTTSSLSAVVGRGLAGLPRRRRIRAWETSSSSSPAAVSAPVGPTWLQWNSRASAVRYHHRSHGLTASPFSNHATSLHYRGAISPWIQQQSFSTDSTTQSEEQSSPSSPTPTKTGPTRQKSLKGKKSKLPKKQQQQDGVPASGESNAEGLVLKETSTLQQQQQQPSASSSPPPSPRRTSLIQQRSKEDFARFFDQIMPPYTLSRMYEVLERIDAKITTTTDGTTETTVRKPLPVPIALQTLLDSTPPSNELQVQVLRFLLYNEDDGVEVQATTSRASLSVDSALIDLLMQARNKSVLYPLFWDQQELRQLAESMQTKTSVRLDPATKTSSIILQPHQLHSIKSPQQLYEEAEELATFLRNHLPTRYLKSLTNMLEAYVAVDNSQEEEVEEEELDLEREVHDNIIIPRLEDEEGAEGDSSNDIIIDTAPIWEEIYKPDISTTKSPPITPTLEEIYEPDRIAKKRNLERSPHPMRALSPALYGTLKTHFHLVADEMAHFFYLDDKDQDDKSVRSRRRFRETDRNLLESRKKWETARDDFVQRMIGLHAQILTTMEEEQMDKSTKVLMSELEEDVIDHVKKDAQAKLKTPKIPHRRLSHVKFRVEASRVDFASTTMNADDSSSVDNNEGSRLADTRVFLENLPIDATEEQILDLYSRCGPIESVQIFNRRPCLDPGPLNKKQSEERRKKQLTSTSATFTKWARPVSPVYGLVEFSNQEGYIRAIDPTLCVFGMIIRRHPVRSIPASRVKSLYLENMSDGESCQELQHELKRALNQQVKLVSHKKSKPVVGSCEIVFPSFDVAFEAFPELTKLKALERSDGLARVQWFRTRKDAEEWWTRDRGFFF